jgi:hypothetical protein
MRASNTSAICIDTSHAICDIEVISRSSSRAFRAQSSPCRHWQGFALGCLWSAPSALDHQLVGVVFERCSKVEFFQEFIRERRPDRSRYVAETLRKRAVGGHFYETPPERTARRLRIPNICC